MFILSHRFNYVNVMLVSEYNRRAYTFAFQLRLLRHERRDGPRVTLVSYTISLPHRRGVMNTVFRFMLILCNPV